MWAAEPLSQSKGELCALPSRSNSEWKGPRRMGRSLDRAQSPKGTLRGRWFQPGRRPQKAAGAQSFQPLPELRFVRASSRARRLSAVLESVADRESDGGRSRLACTSARRPGASRKNRNITRNDNPGLHFSEAAYCRKPRFESTRRVPCFTGLSGQLALGLDGYRLNSSDWRRSLPCGCHQWGSAQFICQRGWRISRNPNFPTCPFARHGAP
jgi:hypothetical protein